MYLSNAATLTDPKQNCFAFPPSFQAERRQQAAGLGAPGSNFGLYSTAGSYKETLKQLTRARYEGAFR